MGDLDFSAISAELAQLRERAKAACENARRLRYEQRAKLERVHARMTKVRAEREGLRQFLRQLRSRTD
jgi:hypothetical protein